MPITADDLAPDECAGMNLGEVVVGSGSVTGTNGSDLIVSSGTGGDTIQGRNGTDCILGGGGADDLRGDQGGDVLMGGPGIDQLNGGSGQDVCYGGPDLDVFLSCETQSQD